MALGAYQVAPATSLSSNAGARSELHKTDHMTLGLSAAPIRFGAAQTPRSELHNVYSWLHSDSGVTQALAMYIRG